MKRLEGRVAVVTGAASGIGLALAQRFVAEGMSVVLADVEADALAAATERFGRDAPVSAKVTDVADADSVEELARHAIERFGAVHVVCNNAGVDSGAPLAAIPLANWHWVLGVNFLGVVHGCRTFLPLLRREDEGHIVNTGSLAALTGFSLTSTPYVASKMAVLGLSENLHHELAAAGETIGVSLLLPSFVATAMATSERNLPDAVEPLDGLPQRRAIAAYKGDGAAAGIAPAAVATAVVEAIRSRRFYVLPEPERGIAALEARLRWIRTDEPPSPRPGAPQELKID